MNTIQSILRTLPPFNRKTSICIWNFILFYNAIFVFLFTFVDANVLDTGWRYQNFMISWWQSSLKSTLKNICRIKLWNRMKICMYVLKGFSSLKRAFYKHKSMILLIQNYQVQKAAKAELSWPIRKFHLSFDVY